MSKWLRVREVIVSKSFYLKFIYVFKAWVLRTFFKDEVRWIQESAEVHVTELVARVQFLVDYMDTRELLSEGCFTFPDGETWWAHN